MTTRSRSIRVFLSSTFRDFSEERDLLVRKVFPDSATPLDFLQELVAINTEFRRDGRTHEGKIVLVTHAKGGVGATTIAAALADVCSEYGRRTMLWDLDVETRDLSRGLNAYGPEEKVVSAWMTGAQEIDRDTLRNALIPIITSAGAYLPYVFMGSLVFESFFGIPGLGAFVIEAIAGQDFAIVRTMVFLGAALYIASNVLIDVAYTWVDPRVRLS